MQVAPEPPTVEMLRDLVLSIQILLYLLFFFFHIFKSLPEVIILKQCTYSGIRENLEHKLENGLVRAVAGKLRLHSTKNCEASPFNLNLDYCHNRFLEDIPASKMV